MSKITPITQSMPAIAVPPSVSPDSEPPVPGKLPPVPGQHPYQHGGVHDARVQALLSSMGIHKPNPVGTILGNAALFGGVGAALGLGASLLPFIGPAAAVIGGGIGVVVGLVKGAVNASDDNDRYNAARAWAEYQLRGGSTFRPQVMLPGHNGAITLPQGWTIADLERLDEIDGDDDPAPITPAPQPNPGGTGSSGSTSTTTTSDGLVAPPMMPTITAGAPPALTGLS